jgi:hypothetical protein
MSNLDEGAVKLLPCAFCGSKAEIENISKPEHERRMTAGCSNENCFAYLPSVYFAREADAIAAWNRRTLSPAADIQSPLTGSGETGWPPLVDLGRVLGFFASVIKSGEPWTATCQAEYDKANRALQALYASPANPAETQAGEAGK